jgi:hypothetical protein
VSYFLTFKLPRLKKKSKNYTRYNRISKSERINRNKIRLIKILPFNNFKDYYVDHLKRKSRSETITPNYDFRLMLNPEGVIKFIETLKKYKHREDIVEILIDLDFVRTIDIGAVSLLLSSVEELSLYGKKVIGTVPKEKSAYKFLIESGFFKNISMVSNRLSRNIKVNNKKNINLLLIGYPQTKGKGKMIGECIKSAIESLTGLQQHYRPIYTLVMEMNANSIEHAYSHDKKHWVFGVNYKKDENKLYFTFADNGLGILNQLNLRFDRRIKQLFKDKNFSDETILKNLFDKKYNSRFKTQINRNRGLPIIQDQALKKTVKNLICITNNIYLNLETKSCINLGNQFTGTFYYWELDLNLFDTYGKRNN